MRELSQTYGLRVANVFHAGDGNLHPLILFDERNPEEVRRVLDAGTGPDSSSCCDPPTYPNLPPPAPGQTASPGGGRVGLLLISNRANRELAAR